MKRAHWLNIYCIAVGLIGWAVLGLALPAGLPSALLLLFVALALLVESVGFRIPPSDPHSLVGIVLVSAALALGAPLGALVAAVSGLLFGLLLPLLYSRPRSFYLLVARPMLRSGVRALALLLGGALADALVPDPNAIGRRMFCFALCFVLVVQGSRALRELLQGGRSGVVTWFRAAWRPALSAEVAPLPIAALGAAIYLRRRFERRW